MATLTIAGHKTYIQDHAISIANITIADYDTRNRPDDAAHWRGSTDEKITAVNTIAGKVLLSPLYTPSSANDTLLPLQLRAFKAYTLNAQFVALNDVLDLLNIYQAHVTKWVYGEILVTALAQADIPKTVADAFKSQLNTLWLDMPLLTFSIDLTDQDIISDNGRFAKDGFNYSLDPQTLLCTVQLKILCEV